MFNGLLGWYQQFQQFECCSVYQNKHAASYNDSIENNFENVWENVKGKGFPKRDM